MAGPDKRRRHQTDGLESQGKGQNSRTVVLRPEMVPHYQGWLKEEERGHL